MIEKINPIPQKDVEPLKQTAEGKKRGNILLSRIAKEIEILKKKIPPIELAKKTKAIKKILPYLMSLVLVVDEGVGYISKNIESFSNQTVATKELKEQGITTERRMGYVAGVSEFIYSAVPPMGYQTILEVLSDIPANLMANSSGITTQQKTIGDWEKIDDDEIPRENFIPRKENIEREDTWRMYLGLPQEHGTFSVSKFQPRDGKEDKFYYSINNWIGKFIENKIIQYKDQLKKLKEDKELLATSDYTKSLITGKDEKIKETELKLENISESTIIKRLVEIATDPKNKGIVYEDFPVVSYLDEKDGNNIVTTELEYGNRYAIMGNFKLSLGKDERGNYISYYDKWDLANNQLEGIVGKPFEIYDRIYYDPNTFEPVSNPKK
ncbi:MAG: hypothetical protein KA515_00605 [Candidatus Pacebacteria bacterium]|nr:hypothetical protein [Candidatus Paceibacterota bacterium]